MVGPTAQLVALAGNFNARAGGSATPTFGLTHSTCKFCESVRFVWKEKRWFGVSRNWEPYAENPEDWLKREARPGRRAAAVYKPDANYGRWDLLVVGDGRMDVWYAGWDVYDSKAHDGRVWRVRYFLAEQQVERELPPVRTTAELAPVLKQALEEIQAFADQHDQPRFSSSFQLALDCLAAEDPFSILPDQGVIPAELLTREDRRVLTACQAGWVFGGMGSWNDMGFEGEEQKRYDRVSAQLLALLNEGISACSRAR